MKIMSPIWLIQVAIGLNLLSSNLVSAQIKINPDGTLPQNSRVTQEENTLKIEGGTQAGNNLFHSFQEFSVLTNQTAFFNNAVNIQNIFSRVTGSSSSTIDGVIRANGTANLFLINPNGIVFGPNASLNLGGSFVASTAERVIFSDGSAFSTLNPQSNPLLTISVPIGLGFGSTPGQINNQSRTRVSTSLIGRRPNQEPTVAGLQVQKGKTITLVGGDVTLQGGHLTANEGRIEIGSVAGNNTVNLIPIEKGWQLDYTGIQSFQNISFLPSSLIDTSGNMGGEIQLQGRQITLTGSQNSPPVLAWSNTVSNGKGGDLVVKASDAIEISGKLLDPSGFRTQTDGPGSAGNILVETKNLTLNVGGQIGSSAGIVSVLNNNPVSTGDAGDITLKTQQLNVIGGLLSTNTYTNGRGGQLNIVASDGILIKNRGVISVENILGSSGDAGDLNLTTNQLILNPFGYITSDASGTGNAGDINLNVNKLVLDTSSQITANTFQNGKGGIININANESVEILNNGFLSSRTQGLGDGGDLIINTNELNLQFNSRLAITTSGRGNAGSLTINANNLNVTEGSRINARTEARGQAGNINVTASDVTISKNARISAETISPDQRITSTGDAGNITLNVRRLILQDGGEISSSSLLGRNTSSRERGNGGTITINADSVDVSGTFTIDNETLTSRIQTLAQGTGDAGSIIINTNNLNVADGGQIDARTENIGQAGSIDVTASNLFVGKNASITVETISTGNAGNITLNADDTLTLDQGKVIANTNSTGNAGTINIKAGQLLIQNGGEISSGSLLGENPSNLERGNGGTITINADSIVNNASNIFTLTQGTGDAGSILLNTNNFYVTDNAQITASTTGEGKAGRINVTASTFSLNNGGQLQTTTAGTQDAGDINIQANTLNLTGLESGLFANTDSNSSGSGGNIFINSQTTNLQNGATISVNSQGTGVGGDITIQGSSLRLDNQASVVAQTASTDGGNITLNLNDRLILRNQSNISATAAQFGNGGNITINAPFILAVPQENSDITANASQGSGGNINITTQGLFGIQFQDKPTPLSDITASSEFGLQGNVNIINPNVDIINRLVELPENPVDVASLIAEDVCTANEARGSSFVVTGRGGLPPNPRDPLTQNGTVDWATRTQSQPKSPVILKERSPNNQPVIQQIQGWKTEADGTIILTADATAVTPESPILAHPACQ